MPSDKTPSETTGFSGETKLVAAIMGQMSRDTNAISSQLMDSYRGEIAELKAWKAIVTERMEEIAGKPYAPSNTALMAALYVSKRDIARYIEDHPDEFAG